MRFTTARRRWCSVLPLRRRDRVVEQLEVSRVAFPVTTLGHGARIGIWVQGCSIRCRGCITAATWDRDAERTVGVAALMDGISDWMSVCDGVTISGGEPLDQPEGVRALLLALRAREVGDILLYTGHSIDHVRAACAWVLRLVDCLVSEPFDAVAPQTLPLRGSDNQQMHRLTAVARERYPSSLDEPESPGATRKLDVFSEGRATYTAGIPLPRERRSLGASLARDGYRLVREER